MFSKTVTEHNRSICPIRCFLLLILGCSLGALGMREVVFSSSHAAPSKAFTLFYSII